ncbi:MAG: hypothetical protein Tsb0013_10920 [Phycisphaerales bacterium]
MPARTTSLLGVTITAATAIAQPSCPEAGLVIDQLNISINSGGLNADLDPGDRFGSAVVRIGDIDADGIDDLAVGAPRDDDGVVDGGAVHILFLNADGSVRSEQKISATSGGWGGPAFVTEDFFGTAVAGIGDLDNDGTPDIAVGAPGVNLTGFPAGLEGAIDILFLNPDGTVKAQQRIADGLGGFTDDLTGSEFGTDIAAIGDVDNDGVVDLAVGAPLASTDVGEVWVLFMRPDGTIKNARRIAPGADGVPASPNGIFFFGFGVEGLGDLDGDGLVDIAVTGPTHDGNGAIPLEGAVVLIDLATDGTPVESAIITPEIAPLSMLPDIVSTFGLDVASLGDLDQDGTTDIAVSSSDANGVADNRVWILFLNPDRSVKGLRFFASGVGGFTGTNPATDVFGTGLGFLGDLDNDGSPSLAVGTAAFNVFSSESTIGSVWILELDDCATLPMIIQQPAPATDLDANAALMLSVQAVGDGTLTYQWFFDGQALTDGPRVSGATTASLSIDPVGASDTGVYSVEVTNAFATATSDPAVVAVRPPAQDCPADFNGTGTVDFFDISDFLNAFEVGCP